MPDRGVTSESDSDFALLKNVIESTGKQIDEVALQEDEDLDALCGSFLSQVMELSKKRGNDDTSR